MGVADDGVEAIGQRTQRDDSLDDQIDTTIAAADKLGCWAAANWLRQLRGHRQAFRAAHPGAERYL